MSKRSCATALMLMVVGVVLAGCESYAMRGHVIRGEVSYVEIVSADDARLDLPGLAGARVGAHLDPSRLNRKFLGETISDSNGDFSLSIDEFGAGWLEYDISVVGYRNGYMGVEQFFRMPAKEKRLLVILAPGTDPEPPSFRERESLFDEADRYR